MLLMLQRCRDTQCHAIYGQAIAGMFAGATDLDPQRLMIGELIREVMSQCLDDEGSGGNWGCGAGDFRCQLSADKQANEIVAIGQIGL